MPECVQTGAKKALQNIFLADTKENARKAYKLFIRTYKLKYPKAAECLAEDYDDLFRFYDFPVEHRIHIRTSNPIESMFATVRLRPVYNNVLYLHLMMFIGSLEFDSAVFC
jgi:putative transposase